LNTTGATNTAVGSECLKNNTTANDTCGVGHRALANNTEGLGNVAMGRSTLEETTTGNYNNAFGWKAGQNVTTGVNNVVVGQSAGSAITTGGNNIAIGKDSARTGSPGGNQTTGSNRIFLGDEDIASAYIQVDWTIASDQRDKTDFTDLDVGLDFVNDLKPVTYKWDKRSKYADKTADDYDLNAQTPDGTHKEDWLDVGFKAQEVEALELAAGYKLSDKTNLTTTLTDDGKQYGLQYTKFIPILVKSIQELSAKNDALLARIKTLEG
jgi:hypothetical protein